jgi:hypothetical protein
VKDFCQSLDFLGVDIIPGGLTPEAQPLDKVINKVFKGSISPTFGNLGCKGLGKDSRTVSP